ncbi:uncharacterized protein [Venturia canescens]|uniref:uncharacterized protein n=1 Tax=Venturia canescens TaxID=32260 RepID=UPI001C9D533B|nr:uncharacterized protein LOC122415753 [Venturia canescens]
MDLQRLITEVQARPAIWDQKNTHYHNRDVILRLWGEIAKACDVSSDVAKSKWKHLRDNFRNELKKTYRGKPPYEGNGSPPNVPDHESKWVWFKSLQFLRDQMNSRVIGGCGGHAQNGVGRYQTSLDETQIEPQIDIVEGDEEAHFDDVDDGGSCTSLMTSEDVMNPADAPSQRRGKISRKRFLMDGGLESIDYHQGVERKRHAQGASRRVSSDEDDDTYHFLMSVRSPMRSLPLERQMYVRLKIQELILSELTALGQQSARAHDPADSQQDTKPQTRGAGAIAANSILQNRSPERATDDNYFS